jgi:putative ABC transport system permease protein
MLLFMLLPALNLVNLNSSRIMERSSEIGVRKAFGATSSTLALQFIVENIVLTLLGGALGLILAYGVLQMIEASQVIEHAQFYLTN